ncbi:hypothetical protein [Terrimonas alba]|uniref:hypothetical protein n=1 Tax=Terrimonas alba TaxID=3349636 RepID=UPI0035F3C73B
MSQIDVIWTGTKIGDREIDGYKISLIQIDSFYVEMIRRLDDSVPERIRTFSSTDQLSPYLSQLNIDGLL